MISKRTAPSFVWREVCDGWRLLDADDVSVIQERMPPGSAEVLHLHTRVRQLYFVLDGKATVDVGDSCEVLGAGDAVVIEPATAHRISNRSQASMEFLVISSSPPRDDRKNLE